MYITNLRGASVGRGVDAGSLRRHCNVELAPTGIPTVTTDRPPTNVREHAKRLAKETGAARLSPHAEEIALLIMAFSQDPSTLYGRVKRTFKGRHPDKDAVFILMMLPTLFSVMQQRVLPWMQRQDHGSRLASMAAETLSISLPKSTATHTSTATPLKKRRTQSA